MDTAGCWWARPTRISPGASRWISPASATGRTSSSPSRRAPSWMRSLGWTVCPAARASPMDCTTCAYSTRSSRPRTRTARRFGSSDEPSDAAERGTTMKLGAYTACLHDRSLRETLKILQEMGLTSAEINAGGFVPAPHLPIAQLLSGATAREEYLGLFEQAGITLTGLNVNGNPLNPDPSVGPKHAEDLRRAITIAGLLGVKRIVAMSGLPAAHEGGRSPSWVVNPWDSQYLDVLDYQWQEVAIPFWKDIDARARDADVKVCIEMHPHNVVYNPATMERVASEINATH